MEDLDEIHHWQNTWADDPCDDITAYCDYWELWIGIKNE